MDTTRSDRSLISASRTTRAAPITSRGRSTLRRVPAQCVEPIGEPDMWRGYDPGSVGLRTGPEERISDR